jgi:glycine hydroxymethyltransferase
LAVAPGVAWAHIVTNNDRRPRDTPQDGDRPHGLRMGTIEVTRWGLRAPEMAISAACMARVWGDQESPDTVVADVIAFRQAYQTRYDPFAHPWPPS